MNKMSLKIMCCLLKKEENELYQIFEGEWKIVVKCWNCQVLEGQAMFLFNKNHACTKAPLNVLHIKRNDVCFTVISGQAQYLFKVVEKQLKEITNLKLWTHRHKKMPTLSGHTLYLTNAQLSVQKHDFMPCIFI